MIPEYARTLIAKAEASGPDCLDVLRSLPLDDFGQVLISLPLPEYPNISRCLPRMASAEVQRNWTGNDGIHLLRQTNTFVRLVSHNFQALCGRPLEGARVLDFGCGYGRIMRSMYYFTDPTNLYGCDPWDVSIGLCKDAGVLGNLAVSEYLPKALPFEDTFDLAYAFSVFTHLSERATKQCLDTLRAQLSPNGLLVITIRPIEYWQIDNSINKDEAEKLMEQHRHTGFAFRPHAIAAVDGDITYGDTSMTLEYLTERFPSLKIAKIERSLDDPWQILVFMRPS
jgi:SAM-dependent methyltransferase